MMSGGRPRPSSSHEGRRGASEPEMEDEDSCNMTAVDPTSMLRSGDDNEETSGSANIASAGTSSHLASGQSMSQQPATVRKEGSKLVAIMNTMRKSEKRKFQMFLQQLASSNTNRSVDLKQLNDMLRLSDDGKWGLLAATSSPPQPANNNQSNLSREQQQQQQPHQPIAPPNYDHILPPNLERAPPPTQPHPSRSTPANIPSAAGSVAPGGGSGGVGSSLLQVAAAAPSLGNFQMSIPVGETSLLVTRSPAGANGGHLQQQSPVAAIHPTDQSHLISLASPVHSQHALTPTIPGQGESFQHRIRAQERYKRYKRTEQILRESGMYNITMQTQELEKKNAVLQVEIEQFNRDASAFLQDVLKNPANKWLRDQLAHQRQHTK